MFNLTVCVVCLPGCLQAHLLMLTLPKGPEFNPDYTHSVIQATCAKTTLITVNVGSELGVAGVSSNTIKGSSTKNIYSHCSVLVSSRNGFRARFHNRTKIN